MQGVMPYKTNIMDFFLQCLAKNSVRFQGFQVFCTLLSEMYVVGKAEKYREGR